MSRRICGQREYGRKRRPGQRKGEEGQSLLEMAFTFPILILLLVAVIDFARVIDASIVLTNAAREGARFGSRDPGLSEDAIKDIAVADVVGSGTNVTHMADFSRSDVTVTIGSNSVTVTVSYDFPMLFGGIVSLDTLHIEKRAVMPIF